MAQGQRPDIEFLLILIAAQTYVLFEICHRLFPPRFPEKKRRVAYVLCTAAACCVIYALCRVVSIAHMAFVFAYTLVAQTACCVLLFRGSRAWQFLLILSSNVVYTNILLLSIDLGFFLRDWAEPYISFYNLRILSNLVMQAAAFALVPLFIRFVRRQRFHASPPAGYWLVAYLLYIFLYYGMIYTQDMMVRNGLLSGYTFLLETGILALNVIVFCVFIEQCRSYGDRLLHALAEKQYSMQKAHFEEVQASNAELRQLRHEMKNYIFYMNYLLNKKDYDALHAYFQELYQREYHQLVEIDTSSSMVDAMLQQKLSLAKGKGISVRQQITPYSTDGISDLDLCVILSNLLDNAMEACAELPEPEIVLRIRNAKGYLTVAVENPTAGDVLSANPGLETSKPQKDAHGIGLQVIRGLVEKYGGSIDFESSPTHFCVRLMLETGPANGGDVK